MVETIKIEATTIPITTTILILLILPLLPLPLPILLPILLLRHLLLHLLPVAPLAVTRLAGQSEEQPTGTEDGASGTRTGALQGGHRRTQRDPILRTRPTGGGMRIRTTPALTATVPSPHTSAWSVSCESIAQRLANQCAKHQPTPTALASTAHTALALSGIAWAYSATCASTTTCGRQPPVTPDIHTLPTSSTTTITPPEINTHTPHAPNCHLPRKWEVRISTRSPCDFGCTGDLSPRLSRHVKRRG
nr:unnamed protein product [Spirometra erinaceieuropaei]